MSALNLILHAVYWLLIAICVLAWGSVAFCWVLFGIAKWKGWLTDDITPAEIMERLAAARQGGKDGAT